MGNDGHQLQNRETNRQERRVLNFKDFLVAKAKEKCKVLCKNPKYKELNNSLASEIPLKSPKPGNRARPRIGELDRHESATAPRSSALPLRLEVGPLRTYR